MSEEQKLAVVNLVRETLGLEIYQTVDGRINAMSQAITTFVERVKFIKEKIERQRIEKTDRFVDKLKEARDSRPKEWKGTDKSYTFMRLSRCIRNWGSVIHKDFDKILDTADIQEYLDEESHEKVKDYCSEEEFKDIKRALHRLVVDVCTGEA